MNFTWKGLNNFTTRLIRNTRRNATFYYNKFLFPSYPFAIIRREIEEEIIPTGSTTDNFDLPEYLRINKSRLDHLEQLDIPVKGTTVLDVGCGVGHLSQFFVEKGCKVVCVDGRLENISKLREMYPGLEAHVEDVESDAILRFGVFDVVFCYGLLYHLENPVKALRNMAEMCRNILILETQVCDSTQPIISFTDEASCFSQALKGLGCRPSPIFVATALNRVGFPFVYAPKFLPDHEDFHFKIKNNLDFMRNGHNLRRIFIASRNKLKNSNLLNLLVS